MSLDDHPADREPFKAECLPDKWPAIDRQLCRQNQKGGGTQHASAQDSPSFSILVMKPSYPINSASINALLP